MLSGHAFQCAPPTPFVGSCMKRLTIAAAAAALMLAVAPRLHAQATQQAKPDTTASAKKSSAKKSHAKSASSMAAAPKADASSKTASTKSRKAKKSSKAKADSTAKKSE